MGGCMFISVFGDVDISNRTTVEYFKVIKKHLCPGCGCYLGECMFISVFGDVVVSNYF